MIVKIGNIFESKCSTIVNTVNCVGVMGKGIALEFKKKYPEMFMEYVLKCNRGEVKPGVPYVYQDDGISILKNYGIESIAFPPLGCGNGGLTWDVVGPIMYQKLCKLPINIEIYAPFGTSSKKITREFLSNEISEDNVVGISNSKINPKWYLILLVVKKLNERKYALKVGRTIYQKICYVLTRNGVDTGFSFSKGSYGPFSSQVKDSITALANANLIIEKQLGKMISLNVSDGFEFHKEKYTDEELNAVKKTNDLFGRVKSTEQAEMIATVLYSYDQWVHLSTYRLVHLNIFYLVDNDIFYKWS